MEYSTQICEISFKFSAHNKFFSTERRQTNIRYQRSRKDSSWAFQCQEILLVPLFDSRTNLNDGTHGIKIF
jgi:hypothetical protein